MELSGTIVQVLPEQSGQSSRGPWRKQSYILEIPGEYPKKLCFMVWGDRIDRFAIREGESLTVFFDLESREYGGRWYTDVKAWRVVRADSSVPPPTDEVPPPPDPDDLPF